MDRKRRSDKSKTSLSGLSLAEAIISLFLLSFVAVMSLTQIGFSLQRKNDRITQALQLSQNVVAEIRAWAALPANYCVSSQWSRWNIDGTSEYDPQKFPGFFVIVQADPTGRSIESPCTELESQYDTAIGGTRSLPNAVVPVDITVSWGPATNQRFQLTTLIGEPKRPFPNGITFNAQCNVNQLTLGGGPAKCTATITDGAGRSFDNLLFKWTDNSLLINLDPSSRRDGRLATFERVTPPAFSLATPIKLPTTATIHCAANYAGRPIRIEPVSVGLP